MVEGTSATTFKESIFGAKTEDVREVRGGASGNAVVKEGDKSLFGDQKELGKQDFLELLVAQLQHQDPLNPSNDQEFVAQLAQFSSLESSQNIEGSMEGLNKNMEAFISSQETSARYMGNASTATMLGKSARIEQASFHYNGAGEVNFDFFKKSIGQAMFELTDAEGNQVAFVSTGGNLNAGDHQFTWDGTNENGDKVPPGEYFINILDTTAKSNKGFAFVEGPIDGVTFENGKSMLTVAGQSYPIEDLKQIVEPNENSQNTPESGDSN